MAKRGRKPKEEEQRSGYFYEQEEQAVLDFLAAESKEEKNEIYLEKLKPAFEKMIESIIRRYKLFIPDEVSGDTFNDTLSFLMTKMSKFKPGKYKAYSYYGTICKNYLIGRLEKRAIVQKRNPSLEDAGSQINNSLKYSDSANAPSVATEIVEKLSHRIGLMIETPENYGLKPSEIKVGFALKNLLDNWEYVLTTDGSNKLNKNAILLYLREETGMETKGIRDNMKKFKKEFLSVKGFAVES